VAPRTVYKATYKYRLNLKALGIELSKLKRGIEKKSKRVRSPTVEAKSYRAVPSRELLLEEIRKVVRETLADIIGSQPIASLPQLDTGSIVEQLNRLEKSIEKLAESINRLALVFSEINSRAVVSEIENINSDDDFSKRMPSFVQGNPWLAVLKSRGRR